LPVGYWKGSGLSIMLDLLATILSDGRSTSVIGKLDETDIEQGVSQVFICFDVTQPDRPGFIDNLANELVDFIHDTHPVNENEKVYYPGERRLLTRQENLEQGIPVDKAIWKKVLAL
jgi:3-dehydro-L-gulonate 2-dehydrogenase